MDLSGNKNVGIGIFVSKCLDINGESVYRKIIHFIDIPQARNLGYCADREGVTWEMQ